MSSKKITVIDKTLWCNITDENKELNINLSYLLNIKRALKKQNKKKTRKRMRKQLEDHMQINNLQMY